MRRPRSIDPVRLVLPALASLALGGCLASVSLGTGGAGVSVSASGARIGIDRRGGVTVAIGTRAGGGAGAGTRRAPSPGPAGTLLRKPLAEGRLTSRFGERRGASRIHRGVDWAAPRGTPVYAAGDGTVVLVETSPSYGHHVRIDHGGGTVTGYAHLAAFAPGLREGARVARGQRIGAVGSTGRSTRPHLHHELLIGGTRVDPLGVSP